MLALVVLLPLLLAATFAVAQASASRASGSTEVAVAAYLPEWRFEGADFDTMCRLSTHLIFFSVEPTPEGGITGLDRLPGDHVLADAKAARDRHGCKLLLCFGGNGRSSGFSPMVRNVPSRRAFARNVRDLVARLGLDGVDLNWEYPGYVFGRGYASDREIEKDYFSFGEFIKILRRELGAAAAITLAYYPDGRQERMLVKHGSPESLDLLHMMTYDQPGKDHSSFDFAVGAMRQGVELGLPAEKLTLGLPFYGRHSQTGDWTTYEDIVQKYRITDADDSVREGGAVIGFNGKSTIRRKTEEALRLGLGGVMIWEVGQDCRTQPVTRSGRTHVATCPEGERSSLLAEIARSIRTHEAGRGGSSDL